MEAVGVLVLVGIVLVWVLVIKGDADRYKARREGKRQAAQYLDGIAQYPYPQPGQPQAYPGYQGQSGYPQPETYPGYPQPETYPGYPGPQG